MYHFIVNPHSRTDRGCQIWEIVQTELDRLQIAYQFTLTEYAGHARQIARDLCRLPGELSIVVIGGDGTVSEVLSGLDQLSRVTLGYIPTGSGNDFARGMHIPKAPLEALHCILRGEHTRRMDVGILQFSGHTRRFGVSCGIGLDAAICHEALHSPLKKRLNRFRLGKLTYFLIALKQLFVCSPSSIRMELDGGREFEFPQAYFAAAFLQPSEGGGMKLCPGARPDDGILEVCVVSKVHKIIVALLLPTAFFGLHTHIPGVHILRCRSIRIHCDTALSVHLDGESGGNQTDIFISLKNRALKVIAPVVS